MNNHKKNLVAPPTWGIRYPASRIITSMVIQWSASGNWDIYIYIYILYCIILYSIIFYYVSLYLLYYIILYYITLYYITLNYVILYIIIYIYIHSLYTIYYIIYNTYNIQHITSYTIHTIYNIGLRDKHPKYPSIVAVKSFFLPSLCFACRLGRTTQECLFAAPSAHHKHTFPSGSPTT